jgi:hypothetical protein
MRMLVVSDSCQNYPKCVNCELSADRRSKGRNTENIFLLEMKQGHSAGAYTETLLVMVNVKKGGGRVPPHPHQPGLISPS